MENRSARKSVSGAVCETLTERAIKAFVGKAERGKKLADGGGLYMIVTAAGGTIWRVKYRIDGSERTYSIGPYPLVTLAAARIELGEIKALLLQHKDPAAKRLLHLGPPAGRRS